MLSAVFDLSGGAAQWLACGFWFVALSRVFRTYIYYEYGKESVSSLGDWCRLYVPTLCDLLVDNEFARSLGAGNGSWLFLVNDF